MFSIKLPMCLCRLVLYPLWKYRAVDLSSIPQRNVAHSMYEPNKPRISLPKLS